MINNYTVNGQYDYSLFLNFLPIIIGLVALEAILKAFALWKSARHNQLGWFVAIIILNTLGILPLLYLLIFQKKAKTPK